MNMVQPEQIMGELELQAMTQPENSSKGEDVKGKTAAINIR